MTNSKPKDAVKELAEKLATNVYPGLNADWPEFRLLHGEFQRIIRAELGPLLEAALEHLCEFGPTAICPKGECTHRHCLGKRETHERLAAELENWI